MVHSYNTVLLHHIYSVHIQNTFGKIQVVKLMSCKVSSEIDLNRFCLSSHFRWL